MREFYFIPKLKMTMPSYLVEAGQITVFLMTILGFHIRTMSKVSSVEKDVHNLSINLAKVEKELEEERKLREVDRKEREKENLSMWKEVSEMKATLSEVVTLIKANNEYIKETLNRHEQWFKDRYDARNRN